MTVTSETPMIRAASAIERSAMLQLTETWPSCSCSTRPLAYEKTRLADAFELRRGAAVGQGFVAQPSRLRPSPPRLPPPGQVSFKHKDQEWA
jgi:hypothetical protein